MELTQQVYSMKRVSVQSSYSNLGLSPVMKALSPKSPSFSDVLQGKSLLYPTPPNTAGKSMRAGSTRSSYRPRSQVKSATSLPATPPSASPHPSPFLVSDLLRIPKSPVPEPATLCAEDPEERLKARHQAAQNDKARAKAAVLYIQDQFRTVPAVQSLVTTFESVCSSITQAQWFNQTGRSQVLTCILHLERTCYRTLEALTPSAEPEPLTAQLPPPIRDRGLERQLEAAAKKIRELESRIRTAPVARLQLVNAQLSARIDSLMEALAQQAPGLPLGEACVKADNSMEALLAARAEIDLKEKEIVKQQFATGRLQVALAEISAEQEAKKREFATMQEAIRLTECRAFKAEEQQAQLQAQLGMMREDMERFAAVLTAYEESRAEVERLKERYGKLEEQMLTGALGTKADTVVKVDLRDPIFALVSNAPLQEANNKRQSLNAELKEIELFAAGAPKIDPAALAHITSEEGRVLTFQADLSKPATVDTSEYRYLRPNFAAFVPESRGEVTVELPFQNWTEVTVRGILDSKHNEHLLSSEEMGRTPSRLVEFAYSWLGQYAVDEGSRQVRGLHWWKKESADHARVLFVQALGAEQSRKSWELHSFKDFLNEELALDELGFYLHCRWLLYEGPQLATPAGRLNAVHYLPLAHCQGVVERLTARLTDPEKQELAKALQAKAKRKAESQHLDSAFVLRLLLEFYRREKRCKYAAIARLFAAAPVQGVGFKRSTAFSDFKSICRSLNQDFSELQVARLYRDTWAAGNGTVNADTFFLVLNESPALFHCLRLPALWKPALLTSTNEADPKGGVYSQSVAQVLQDWKQMSRSAELTKDCVTSMGCSEVAAQLAKMEAIFSGAESDGRSVLELYKRYWVALAQVSVVYMESNAWVLRGADDLEFFDASIRQVVELRASLSTFTETLRGQRLKRLSQRLAAARIQRTWKSKVKRNLSVLAMVVRSVGRFKRLLHRS